MSLETLFARYAEDLDAELRSVVPAESGGLFGLVAYHLGWVDEEIHPAPAKAGKNLRPTLCLLSSEAAGGDYRRALPAAAALELVHNFSLVHDDIQDRSLERRHRRAVWAIWGEGQAINAGDALYALAHQAMFRLAERGVPADLALAAAGHLDRAALALCSGQFADLAFEDRADVSTAEYFEMVRGKTAALLGASAAIGALLGSGDRRLAALYRDFGERLGVAFQIQDDVLGIWGDPRVTGKPAADDVRSRKKTLPVLQTLDALSGEPRERLRALYRLPGLSEEQVAAVIAILDADGARERTEAQAREWYEQALDRLEAAHPLPGPRDDLRALAGFLVGRTY